MVAAGHLTWEFARPNATKRGVSFTESTVRGRAVFSGGDELHNCNCADPMPVDGEQSRPFGQGISTLGRGGSAPR